MDEDEPFPICLQDAPGWNGSGLALEHVTTARGLIGDGGDVLAAALPRQWHSTAADAYRERIEELLTALAALSECLSLAQEATRLLAQDVYLRAGMP